jgi:hypothetical protein
MSESRQHGAGRFMTNGLLTPPVRNNLLEPVRPRAVSPDRALCLPTFSHFLIVNKTSLSLSLSLFLGTDRWRSEFVNAFVRSKAHALDRKK